MTIASIPARTAGPHPRLPACDSSCVVHFGPQRGAHARVSSGCEWLSSQAEKHEDGSEAILGAESAEQGCTSANGYGPSVVGPSVKERRNGSFRTCDRDLLIIRSDRDDLAWPRPAVRISVWFQHEWEAASGPQDLQKVRQVVHGLDKSHGNGKVSATRQHAAFVPAIDDLEGSARPHS
jgi:hypothetical protein